MNVYELEISRSPDGKLRPIFEEAAEALGLITTQVTTLAKYPGCTHWHFKRGRSRGTLEATYWPDRNRAWLSYRPGREADWIRPMIREFKSFVEMRAVATR